MIPKVFPTIEGNLPYEHKYTTPYYELYLTDTPYTVKSRGMDAYWYVSNSSAKATIFSNQIWQSNIPLIKVYSGKYWPAEVSNYYSTYKRYGVRYTGYFNAQSTNASFWVAGGNGYCDFLITNNSGTKSSSTVNLAGELTSIISTGSLTQGQFYKIDIWYWTKETEELSENAFVAFWKDSTVPKKLPISAGYFVGTDDYLEYAGFIPATKLDYIMNPEVTNARGDISKLTFEIPLAPGTVGFSAILGTVAETAALWHFRNNLIDSTGGNHNLGTVGNPGAFEGYTTGYSETGTTAVELDGGINSLTLSTLQAEDLRMGTMNFTCEAIIKTEQLNYTALFEHSNPLDGSGYVLGFSDGTPFTYVGNGLGLADYLAQRQSIFVADNKWHHVVWVVERDHPVFAQVRIYIDGIETSDSPFDISTYPGSFSPATNSINGNGGQFWIGDQHKGHIDEAAIHKRVLTDSEILKRARAVASEKGYKYVQNGAYFQNVENTNQIIKKFTMVEFNTGYKYPNSTISTLSRFVGQVRNWTINRSGNRNSVTVECYDWLSFLKDALNTGYPNYSDYLMAGYTPNNNIDPALTLVTSAKPRAYDGWTFDAAIDNILYNAYIDPYTTLQKKKQVSVDNEITNTQDYLSEEKNRDVKIYLDRQPNYGNPYSAADRNDDDPYLWQFSIGDRLNDNLQKIMDNYGIRFGFNNNGNFYARSVKVPSKIKTIHDFTFSGSWATVINFSAIGGLTKYSNTTANTAVATFTGRCCNLVLSYPDSQVTFRGVSISLSNPTLGNVVTASLNTGWPFAWSYYDGENAGLGYNPSVIKIGKNLPYGTYSLQVEIISIGGGPGEAYVNALMVYDKDEVSPELDVYTGDLNNNLGVITNLNINSKADNLRNDVIVVGKSRGPVLSDGLDDSGEPLNPNNIVDNRVVSRAVDLRSLGHHTYSSYVGRPLQLLILEPSIGSEERAKWLSLETIKRYNKNDKSREISVSISGNPLIQVEDMVNVVDIKTSTTASHSYWVNSVVDGYRDFEHTTRLTLESFEPWESYFLPPAVNLDDVGGTPFNFVTYENFGWPLLLAGNNWFNIYGLGISPTAGYDAAPQGSKEFTIYYNVNLTKSFTDASLISAVTDLIPHSGYIKAVTSSGTVNLIQYTEKSVSANVHGQAAGILITFSGITDGIYNSTSLSAAQLLHCTIGAAAKELNLGVSPYGFEDFGILPRFSFKVPFPGNVRVNIVNREGLLVTSLSKPSAAEIKDTWVSIKPGTHPYTWGMMDLIGLHNTSNSFGFVPATRFDHDNEVYDIGKGFYVVNDRLAADTGNSGRFQLLVEFEDPTKQYTTQTFTLNDVPVINTYFNYNPRRESNAEYLVGPKGISHPDEGFDVDVTYPQELSVNGLKRFWYNPYHKQNYTTIYPATHYFYDGVGEYRNKYGSWYFTGTENGGKGIKLNLKNIYGLDRIVSIKKRIRGSAAGSAQSRYNLSTKLFNIDGQWETISENVILNNTTGVDIYIKPPDQPFLSADVWAWIDTYLKNPEYTLDPNLESNNRHLLLFLMYFYLVLVDIEVIDRSGRRKLITYSIYWVPESWNNLEKSKWDGAVTTSTTVVPGLGATDSLGRKLMPPYGWKFLSSADVSAQVGPGGVYRKQLHKFVGGVAQTGDLHGELQNWEQPISYGHYGPSLCNMRSLSIFPFSYLDQSLDAKGMPCLVLAFAGGRLS